MVISGSDVVMRCSTFLEVPLCSFVQYLGLHSTVPVVLLNCFYQSHVKSKSIYAYTIAILNEI